MTNVPFLDLKRHERPIRTQIRKAIQTVLDHGSYILGPEVRSFEQAFGEYCGVPHALGVSSGSSALRLALLASGIQPGDEVITTPLTFIATTESITQAGGKVVFADIDPETLTLSPTAVEKALSLKTKAILPVHLYGQTCDMDGLMDVAKAHNLTVIEDAAQAHGALYKGRKVGSLGHAACFSFFPTKNLGGYGDGGMVVTSDKAIADRVTLLRNHGRTEHYRHAVEGYNERLDTLQAAVLEVKLKSLDRWNKERGRLAALYIKQLKGLGLSLPTTRAQSTHVYHLFTIRSRERDRLREQLTNENIGCAVHYPEPLHLQEAYRYLNHKPGDFPHAERAAQEVLSLPLFPGLKTAEALRVANAVKEFFKK